MGRDFDLKLNFPVTGLDNIDKAENKLNQLGTTVDSIVQKITGIAPATSQSMAGMLQASNQAVRSTTQAAVNAAQMAANAAKTSAQQSTQAYQQLTQAIQQANAAMQQTPRRTVGGGGAGGGGGSPTGGGGGGGRGGGGGGFHLNASHPRVALFQALGLGAGGYMGFQILKDVAEDIKRIIDNTTEGARQLQNFANVMGLSVKQAQEFSAAAKLSGVEASTLESSIRTLSQALEDPAGSGKKAADALRQLGIETVNLKGDLRDPGQIAVELVERLGNISDAAKRDEIGIQALGRSFKELAPLVANFKNTKDLASGFSDAFGQQTQDDLLKAHEALEKIHLTVEQLERQLVAGVAPAIEKIADLFTKVRSLQGGKNYGTGDVNDPSRQGLDAQDFRFGGTGLGIHFATDKAQAAARKQFEWNNLTYLQSQQRSAKQKADLDAASIGQIYDGGKTPDKSLLDRQKQEAAEEKKYADRIKEIQQQDRTQRRITETFPEFLAKMKDKVTELEDGNKGPVAKLDEQFNAAVRRFQLKPFSKNWLDLDSQFRPLREDAVRQQKDRAEYKDEKLEGKLDLIIDRANDKALKDGTNNITNGLKEGDPLMKYLFGVPFPDVMPPGFSAAESGQMGRTLGRGVSRINASLGRPGDEGRIAAENLNFNLREIEAQQRRAVEAAKELEDAKQIEALEKARFDAAKSGLEAVIQYEQEIASIRKQQMEETRSFTVGLFNAGLSGGHGVPSFLKGMGRNYADTVVGNVGVGLIGTMNSRLTLQHDMNHPGALGAPDAKGQFQSNWLGKILSGTPFGVDAAKGGKIDPLQDITSKNTDATRENNERIESNTTAVRDLVGVIGRLAGVDTSTLPGMSSGQGIAATTGASANPANALLTPAIKGAIQPVAAGVQNVAKSIEKSAANSPTVQIISSGSGDSDSSIATDDVFTSPTAPLFEKAESSAVQSTPKSPKTGSTADLLHKTIGQVSSLGSLIGAFAKRGGAESVIEKVTQAVPRAVSMIAPLPSARSGPYSPKSEAGGSISVLNESTPSRQGDTTAPYQPSNFDWLSNLVGGPGGTSGFAGRVNLSGGGGSTYTESMELPSSAPRNQGGNVALPFDLSSYSHTTLPDWGPIPTAQLPSNGNPTNNGSLPGSTDAEDDTKTASGLAKTLGQMLGGSKYGAGGYGADAVIFGDGRNADGSWENLSGSERAGAGMAMGAQVAGGTLAALNGFKKGGTQGIIQGVAGTAAAIAPFTGPAAPFIEGGAAILGLVSSLFPDPRQERQYEETDTLTHNAFISPAARDYDFSNGDTGSGFSLGMGSSMRSGGPNANYSVTISAVDAASFSTWAANNPQEMGQAVLAGIQQGGLGALDAEIAWRSRNGGSIPAGW